MELKEKAVFELKLDNEDTELLKNIKDYKTQNEDDNYYNDDITSSHWAEIRQGNEEVLQKLEDSPYITDLAFIVETDSKAINRFYKKHPFEKYSLTYNDWVKIKNFLEIIFGISD